MKITNIEKKALDFIIKYKKYIFIAFITIAALVLRLSLYKIESGDYKTFLEPWVNEYKKYGGIVGLKYTIGNYNCLYNYILMIISLIKIRPLYLIKTVSVIFDFICAIFGYKIIKNITNNKKISYIAYIVILFAPTCIMNSSLWGQCDSIYTAFALISIYYLIKEKYVLSFVFAGISFAFKLQFIFLLPVYIIYYCSKRNISILNFLIIPIINILFAIPAILMGRNIKDTLLIYINQTDYYSKYTLNLPNMYQFVSNNTDHLEKLGIIICIVIFASILYIIIDKKINLNKNKILLLSMFSVLIATYFLPHMHDRYLFMADILSILWFLSQKEKKYLYIPVAINLVSAGTYIRYLFSISLLDQTLLALIYLIILLILSYDVLNLLLKKNKQIET